MRHRMMRLVRGGSRLVRLPYLIESTAWEHGRVKRQRIQASSPAPLWSQTVVGGSPLYKRLSS